MEYWENGVMEGWRRKGRKKPISHRVTENTEKKPL
jgi:hypothetical protein